MFNIIVRCGGIFMNIDFFKQYDNVSFDELYHSFNIQLSPAKSITNHIVAARDKEYMHYPYALEKKFYNAIIQGNEDDIYRYGFELSKFTSTSLCKDSPIRSLKNGIICNCSTLTRLAIEAGMNDKTAFILSDCYIQKIEELNTIEELQKFNSILYLDFIIRIRNVQRNQEKYSIQIKKVINYIQNHLNEHLTLDRVSQEVDMNPKYISHTFKKETGVAFTEYIHKKRIEEAQQLIQFTEYSILDIAFYLGYCNQSYFSRQFKRFVGLTPKQYLQSVKKGT